MQDEDMQPIFKIWAAKKLGIKPEDIKEVYFETVYGGYCETCGYSTFGASVYMNDGGKSRTIEAYDATEVMKDLLKIAEQLR